ncbi:hypothetical protein E2C00_15420 [Streptomyces sp. WAC05374]|uniref:hypothetical protein n=1 Tax=Streptomyces sp. WAC05374 TaxID=2487420 RepID=UPI000F8912D9|nr:hypothetical protein [Streptomyces sp. WAC05374]RST12924.1 hypothetical protein EF905_21490 [Streptomyces sp. WAC05374]TDF48452.1 hypothetical protein E2B92_06145 [Streptomyces sp. WAC05374]TDF54992.1 hypothetical protein E2C02_16240 [Streptomyces sp. WAC05374]TDF55386.1 hypothetical protein E2C00_15420 [Streptomyces sp. WAC05374]
MKRTRARVAAAVLATVMAALVTGCGSGTPDAPEAAAPPAKGGTRPLTEAEQLRVTDAQQRLISTCMARQGFTYHEAERLSPEESRTSGYVSDDVDWARAHGYGSRIAAKHERAKRANPNVAYRQGLPAERRTAYDKALDEGAGAPELTAELPTGGTVRKRVGGCVAESERRLYGDPGAWFRAEKTVMSLQPLYVPKVMADPRFTAALAQWARCMDRAGHPYRDPADARRAARTLAFAAERELAVADATCARDTRLKVVGKELETRYVNELRGRYGEELDTYARLRLRALGHAATVVPPRT